MVSGSATYSFSMPAADIQLTANFELIGFEVSVAVQPEGAANIIGGGTYTMGQTVTVEAIAEAGYRFTGWTGVNETMVSTDKVYGFEMPAADIQLTANFELIGFEVSVSVQPEGAGTVTGNSGFTMGEQVQLQAQAEEGYRFVNWTSANGTVVSTEQSYGFEMPAADIHLTANFKLTGFEVSVAVQPEGAANIIGCGTYTMGQTVTIEAIAEPGYHFTGWTGENGSKGSDISTYSFSMPAADTYLTANFELIGFEISVSVMPQGAGTIQGNSSYTMGEQIQLQAHPEEGYRFVNWICEQGKVVSDEVIHGFEMPAADVCLTANFELIGFEVSVSVQPEGAANLIGAGTYTMGQTVTVEAIAEAGYRFTGWAGENGSKGPDIPTYSFSMPATDIHLTANFELIGFEVSVSVQPEGAASITGGGTYTMGQTVTVEAIAEAGYRFTGWTGENGNKGSDIPTYSFSMPPADIHLTANFELIGFEVIVDIPEGSSANVSGAGTYTAGEMISLSIDPSKGFRFKGWLDADGRLLSEKEEYSFTMPAADVRLMADMEHVRYRVSITSPPGRASNIKGAGSYHMGEEVTLIAVPAKGYRFVSWAEEGDSKSLTEAVHSFTMPAEDIYLTANFEPIDYRVHLQLGDGHKAGLSGGGIYHIGDVVHLEAVPAHGYEFVNWTDADGNELSRQASYHFIMPAGDLSIRANLAYTGPVALKAYPVPARDRLTIESNVAMEQVRVFALSGRMVMALPAGEASQTLDVGDLPVGMYIIQVQTAEGVQTTRIQVSR